MAAHLTGRVTVVVDTLEEFTSTIDAVVADARLVLVSDDEPNLTFVIDIEI